jgi:hypothetical protein
VQSCEDYSYNMVELSGILVPLLITWNKLSGTPEVQFEFIQACTHGWVFPLVAPKSLNLMSGYCKLDENHSIEMTIF